MKRSLLLTVLLCISASANAFADNILIFGDRPGDSANLASDLTGLGHTVTNVGALPGGPLGAYDTIWHVGAFAPLSGSTQASLATYVSAGGGLHLTGERPCCEALNGSIETFLNGIVSAGGITVGGLGDIGGPYPFNPNAAGNATTNPNTLGNWGPSAPGGAAGLGGLAAPSNVLVTGTGGTAVGGIWDSADLVGGNGRITLLMDVNWFTFDGGRVNIIDNLQTYLAGGQVTAVPEPASLAIWGSIGLGMIALRRRRKSA